MKCCNQNCDLTATRTLIHQGEYYDLCGWCHEQALNTLGGIKRLTQQFGRLVSIPRAPRLR